MQPQSLWSGSAYVLCMLRLQKWSVFHLRLTLTVCSLGWAAILNNLEASKI